MVNREPREIHERKNQFYFRVFSVFRGLKIVMDQKLWTNYFAGSKVKIVKQDRPQGLNA
jgi:hypothetical protein